MKTTIGKSIISKNAVSALMIDPENKPEEAGEHL